MWLKRCGCILVTLPLQNRWLLCLAGTSDDSITWRHYEVKLSNAAIGLLSINYLLHTFCFTINHLTTNSVTVHEGTEAGVTVKTTVGSGWVIQSPMKELGLLWVAVLASQAYKQEVKSVPGSTIKLFLVPSLRSQ